MSGSEHTSTQPLAVVLLSGGLDSMVTAALAQEAGFAVHALTVDYGQRHRLELESAARIAKQLGLVRHTPIALDLRAFGGSALTDAIDVPKGGVGEDIPVTYVPARNLVFLALTTACAEAAGARDVFIGVNALDYSGYPDCRPEYIAAYEVMANLATRAGAEGNKLHIRTPLIHLSKADIIKQGVALGVDYGLTVSCYQANDQGEACGKCDSCRLRKQGFVQAGIADPTHYQSA